LLGLIAAVHILSEICNTKEDIVLLGRIEGYQGDVKELVPVLKHVSIESNSALFTPSLFVGFVLLNL